MKKVYVVTFAFYDGGHEELIGVYDTHEQAQSVAEGFTCPQKCAERGEFQIIIRDTELNKEPELISRVYIRTADGHELCFGEKCRR